MITFTLFSILFAVWFFWRWRRTSIFTKHGIPGPKPNLLFGNMIELFKKGPLECHEEWVKKYGSVVGYYYGMKPVLLVADPQLLKNIYIKDFSKFINREPFSPLAHPVQTEEINQSVLLLRGEKWKERRSVLTPTFSTAKMKKMAVTMNTSIDFMVEILRKRAEKGEIFNIHDTYKRLTLDVISKTAFGISLDVQTNPKSSALRVAQIIFSTPYRDIFVFFGLCFPLLQRAALEFQQFFSRIFNKGASPLKTLRRGLRKVIQGRRKQTEAHAIDLLQLMIDARIGQNLGVIDVKKLEAGGAEENEAVETSEKTTRSMTDDEIVASSTTVFLAGYETTSTALAFTTYLLSKNQHVQERIYEEVEELVQNGEKLEYGTINRLPYLEKALNESLRLYPPVIFFTNRYASETIRYGSLTIPEGMIIQAPAYLLQRDPDYWPDPETFDPERFDTRPNSNGITYFPFGIGPRNCLGMRFAQMEIKLALAQLIYNFKIELSADQMNEFPVSTLIRTLTPKNGVKVRLESRKHEDNS